MEKTDIKTEWQYLEEHPHPWRKQLYIKGRRQRAFTVWMDMLVNNLTLEEVADSKELPIAAVMEAIEYCENNRELLEMEAEEERKRLKEKGISFEPKTIH